MKLTIQIQLFPTTEQAASLQATIERFNAAADWLAGEAFRRKTANKILLQQLYYRTLRDEYGLSAQMACLCVTQVSAAYKRDKAKRPHFRKHAAMPFDRRILAFKGIDRVSLLTLDGRVLVPMVMGRYQQERFSFAKGQSDLVRRKDGRWFLLATIDLPDGTPTPTTDFLGVDLGIVNIATTSDGETFTGEAIEHIRQRHHRNRQRFQKRGTRGAKKRLRKLAGRESRFRRHQNHVISKALVATAKGTDRGLALEELKGIRNRTEKQLRRPQRARHAGWAFFQLRAFIEYKAKLAALLVVLVDPRNSSRTCSACGHCEKANRKSQAEFVCCHCGYSLNADYNAALNLSARASCKHALELSDGTAA